jgi:hypothetical protein
MFHAKPQRRSSTLLNIARLALPFVLVFTVFHPATSARPAKKYSCESCPVPEIDGRASTPLGTVTKTSGCSIGKGTAGLPMPDPRAHPVRLTLPLLSTSSKAAACELVALEIASQRNSKRALNTIGTACTRTEQPASWTTCCP